MRYSDAFGTKSSKIFLGTAYFGDGICEKDAFRIMDRFRELGGTHIDTARLYADGKAEEIVGRWLKKTNSTNMHVFSKGGYYDPDKGEAPRITEAAVRSDLKESLLALKCDTIEFYWLHRDDENIAPEEVVKMMNAFVKEGKIKKFGASNWRSERISAVNKYAAENSLMGFSASQIRFNPAYCITERSGLVGMDANEFMFYRKNNMPLVAYSSQAKGFFSKMAEHGEAALSEKAKKRYLCDENLEKLEIIKALSKKYNCSVAAIVCSAMTSLSTPDVFPIIGGSSVSQIEDSMQGADLVLEKEELQMIFKEYTIS